MNAPPVPARTLLASLGMSVGRLSLEIGLHFSGRNIGGVMANDAWLNDLFTNDKKRRQMEEEQREAELRYERKLDALIPDFVQNLTREVRESVDAFNSRAAEQGHRHAIIVDERPGDVIFLRADKLEHIIRVDRTSRTVTSGSHFDAMAGKTPTYKLKLDGDHIVVTQDQPSQTQPGAHIKDMLREFFREVLRSTT